MYHNLKKEMKKRKVTQKMIADLFSGRQATISYKIQHHKFYVDEAIKIKNAFFSDCDIADLFSEMKKD